MNHANTVPTYGQSIRCGKDVSEIGRKNQLGQGGEICHCNVNNSVAQKAWDENLIDDMDKAVGGGDVSANNGCVVDADAIVVRHIDGLLVDHCQRITRSSNNCDSIQTSWSDMVCKKIGKMQLPLRCQELGEKRLVHCIESHVVGSKDTSRQNKEMQQEDMFDETTSTFFQELKPYVVIQTYVKLAEDKVSTRLAAWMAWTRVVKFACPVATSTRFWALQDADKRERIGRRTVEKRIIFSIFFFFCLPKMQIAGSQRATNEPNL